MPRYIDADEATKIIKNDCLESVYYTKEDAIACIECVPTADVQEVKHGKWIMSSDRPDTIICSVCGAGYDVWKHEAKDFKHCPNCGAKMDKE